MKDKEKFEQYLRSEMSMVSFMQLTDQLSDNLDEALQEFIDSGRAEMMQLFASGQWEKLKQKVDQKLLSNK